MKNYANKSMIELVQNTVRISSVNIAIARIYQYPYCFTKRDMMYFKTGNNTWNGQISNIKMKVKSVGRR